MEFLNKVFVAGKFHSIEFAYEKASKFINRIKTFYRLMIDVPRLSDKYDTVPFIVSKELAAHIVEDPSTLLSIEGSIRTRNNNGHVDVFAYARDINVLSYGEYSSIEDKNRVRLEGTICKEPNFRKTNGGRAITDLILATHEAKKNFYIPCIAWGPDAYSAKHLRTGDKISLAGRFQSRTYFKKDDTNCHTAYEVSVLEYNIQDLRETQLNNLAVKGEIRHG